MIINDCNINYIDYGNKKGKTIVLLHGWGQNIEMMKSVGDQFQNTHRIIILDLPGFGQSSEPTYAWQLEEYIDEKRDSNGQEKYRLGKPGFWLYRNGQALRLRI